MINGQAPILSPAAAIQLLDDLADGQDDDLGRLLKDAIATMRRLEAVRLVAVDVAEVGRASSRGFDLPTRLLNDAPLAQRLLGALAGLA